jgi:replicative DNA helicase
MISRKEKNVEESAVEDISKPFIDVNLELKCLRFLLFDNDFDNKTYVDEINSNISHVMCLGLSKEAFTSDFKQWLFELIIEKFVKFSECVSKSYIQTELKSKYQTQIEIYEQKKVVLDKIFSNKFELKTFKPLVEILRAKYIYRNLLDLTVKTNEKLKQDFNNNKSEPVAIAQDVQEIVNKLIIGTSQYRVIEEDVLHDVENDIKVLRQKKENPAEYRGIPSGYDKIDLATGGWRPGEFNLVLGRPEQGKSVLLLNFGYNAYILNYNVIYVTIEMPYEQQKNRFYSLATRTSYNKIKMPHLMSDEEIVFVENKYRKLKEEHKNYFFFIDAPAQCTTQFVGSRISAFESTNGQKADLLIIDPVYLMTPSDTKAEDKVGVVSWDIKLLARSKNIPVLGASQFNRESHKRHTTGKEVDSIDAAFTDKLGYNVDMMIGIVGDKETAQLNFPKSRDSRISKLNFIKNFDIMKFEYDNRVEG